MGYFASLMRQSGPRRQPWTFDRRTRSHAIDVEETRIAESSPEILAAPAGRVAKPPVSTTAFSHTAPPPALLTKDVAVSGGMQTPLFAASIEAAVPGSAGAPLAGSIDSTPVAADSPPASHGGEGSDAAHAPERPSDVAMTRIGEPVLRRESGKEPQGIRFERETRGITLEEVRAWVAKPARQDSEVRPRSSVTQEQSAGEVRGARSNRRPAVQHESAAGATADNYTLEIGTIQIVMEEARPPQAQPPAAPRPAAEPASSSWTLASRHYLRP